MTHDPNSAAIAALDICESLLLALVDHKVLTLNQVLAILQDVSDLHTNSPLTDIHAALHRRTAKRLEILIRSRAEIAH